MSRRGVNTGKYIHILMFYMCENLRETLRSNCHHYTMCKGTLKGLVPTAILQDIKGT